MRVLEYRSNDKINCMADAEIYINEHELGVIDNALYELSQTEKYQGKKDFMEIRTVFHLIRELVNHGNIDADEIKFAYDEYNELGRYECYKELEKKERGE